MTPAPGSGRARRLRKRLWVPLAVLAAIAGLRIAYAPDAVRVRPMPAAPPVSTDAFGDPLPPFATARVGTIRFRGGGYGLGWTDGGTALVSCGSDGVVRVFDAETGLVRREFVAHRGLVEPGGPARSAPDAVARVFSGAALTSVHDVPFAAAVSRDGRRIVTAGPAAVSVWDTATGSSVGTWRARTASVSCLAISAAGGVVAQGGFDGRVDVRDVASVRRIARLREPSSSRRAEAVQSLALSDSGDRIAYFAENVVVAASVGGRARVDTAEEDGGTVALSPKGDVLVHGSLSSRGEPRDGWSRTPLVFRDAATGDARSATEPFRGDMTAPLAFRGDGAVVASGGPQIALVDVASGGVVREIDLRGATASELAWSPDGLRLAALCGGTIRVFDAASGAETRPDGSPFPCGWNVTLSPDGRTLAVGHESACRVDLHDARTGALVRTVGDAGRRSSPVRAWIDADGVHLIAEVPGVGFAARTWDAATGELRSTHPIGTWSSITGDGRPVLTRRTDRPAVVVLDPSTGAGLATIGEAEDHAQFALTPDRRFVVEMGDLVQVLDASGSVVAKADLPTREWGSWYGAAFSPDSAAMAFADGHRVTVLDVATGRKLGGLDAPEADSANPVALSPGARLVATAGADAAIRLRELATGDVVATLSGHRARVARLVFSDDGRTLVSVAETVLVWDVAAATGR